MSENRIETAADEADSPSEETQEEVCEVLSSGAEEVVDSEGVEEAAKGESDEDNPYDLGITREGVAEATSDMNDIYRDGVAIAVDLKDALSEIKEALDFSDILPTKKK